jgi:hypothetical protein
VKGAKPLSQAAAVADRGGVGNFESMPGGGDAYAKANLDD